MDMTNTHLTKVRLLRDSREGNPSKGIPISTVVSAGDILTCVGISQPDDIVSSQRHLVSEAWYSVIFPDGSTRACPVSAAEPVEG